MLTHEQIPYKYLVDDLQKLVNEQQMMRPLLSSPGRLQKSNTLSSSSTLDYDYTNYGTFEQVKIMSFLEGEPRN